MRLGAREPSDSPLDEWPGDVCVAVAQLRHAHTRLQDLAQQDAIYGSEPCHTATLSEAVTQYEDQLGVWVHDLNNRSEELESLLLRLNWREQLQEFYIGSDDDGLDAGGSDGSGQTRVGMLSP